MHRNPPAIPRIYGHSQQRHDGHYGETNVTQRLEGFRTWMAENLPDVEILEVNYVEKIDSTNALTIFEDQIQKYGVGGFDGVAT